MTKYTIKDFTEQFKDEATCLELIYRNAFPNGATCPKCDTKNHFYPVVKRKCYSCQCGFQVSPTKGTIFHKSPTPLKTWFFAIFLMMSSKNGVSAKELERQLGVTYKCAWRMAHQIRKLLQEPSITLSGTVEVDETYVGGRKLGSGSGNKNHMTAVMGMVQRQGSIIAHVIPNAQAETLVPKIEKYVLPESVIITDEHRPYRLAKHRDFKHKTVSHKKKEYVRGIYYTNTIEGFWSQLKRSIHGTFHFVSRKHLQNYVNEFAYRYNRRKSETPMFLHALEQVAAKHA